MSPLAVRPPEDCRYDLVALGEVMLRLDPGETRISTARRFDVWEGGGEYNVARGLRRCFGLRTGIVTVLADNPIGRLVEDLVLQGGVDTEHLRWVPYDGVGRSVRNGLNFTERGHGLRGALGVPDRGHTAVSQMQPGDVDWDHLFGAEGVRWFHTGGIFAGLSESTAAVAEEAMAAARRHGTVVSYDLNYRPSLWQAIGGPARAQEVNRRLAALVDVMFGCLGLEAPARSEEEDPLDVGRFHRAVEDVAATCPQLQVVATTLRRVRSATVNHWGAVGWSRVEGFAEAVLREDVEILDRVGGGDSFASGLAYGLMTGRSLAEALEYGTAHGALAMTTPGDTSMATLAEVEALVTGATAQVRR